MSDDIQEIEPVSRKKKGESPYQAMLEKWLNPPDISPIWTGTLIPAEIQSGFLKIIVEENKKVSDQVFKNLFKNREEKREWRKEDLSQERNREIQKIIETSKIFNEGWSKFVKFDTLGLRIL